MPRGSGVGDSSDDIRADHGPDRSAQLPAVEKHWLHGNRGDGDRASPQLLILLRADIGVKDMPEPENVNPITVLMIQVGLPYRMRVRCCGKDVGGWFGKPYSRRDRYGWDVHYVAYFGSWIRLAGGSSVYSVGLICPCSLLRNMV